MGEALSWLKQIQMFVLFLELRARYKIFIFFRYIYRVIIDVCNLISKSQSRCLFLFVPNWFSKVSRIYKLGWISYFFELLKQGGRYLAV